MPVALRSFKKQKIDVRLAGNIGYPILSIQNFNKKTLFVIEASSYQLEYSRLFKSKYAVILNISPDHLERHLTLQKYISAKFKLIENQSKNSLALINKNNNLIMSKIKRIKYKSKIVKVDTKLTDNFVKKLKNKNFLSGSNLENLSFVIKLSEILKVRNKNLFDAIKKFKGLKYRQQIIFKNKDLTIINDSKSTSYSSSIEVLKEKKYLLDNWWYPKKGDKFNLPNKYFKNIKGYIFWKKQKKFLLDLNKKIELKKFSNLKNAWITIIKDIKNDNLKEKTILFSPAAASFDYFKNFEDRGKYFNRLINRYKSVR